MIVKEYYKTRLDGVKLYRIYSDDNRYIIQNETSITYTEAIDVENAPYTYSEGDIIPADGSIILEEKAAAYDILTGVTE